MSWLIENRGLKMSAKAFRNESRLASGKGRGLWTLLAVLVTLTAMIPVIVSQSASVSSSINGISSNVPPSILDLQSNLTTPQEAGTVIQWNASATDYENDTLSYEFLLRGPRTGGKWVIVQDWNSSSNWSWKTDSRDVGIPSSISVQIRDGIHSGPESMDDFRNISDYEILRSEFVSDKNIYVKPLKLAVPSVLKTCDIVMSFSATRANAPYTLTIKFYNNYGDLADPTDLSFGWSPQDAAHPNDRLQRISLGTFQLNSVFGARGDKSFRVGANIDGCISSKTATAKLA